MSENMIRDKIAKSCKVSDDLDGFTLVECKEGDTPKIREVVSTADVLKESTEENIDKFAKKYGIDKKYLE